MTRVLKAFITAGLFFMLIPGTFLGVWNLIQVTSRESVSLVSASWLQAHGHAQIFGWIGSFILGIGFYSVPKLRAGARPTLAAAWTCWTLWTLGVALRWSTNVYEWQWRTLLPISGLLELAAFLTFFRVVSRHRPAEGLNAAFQPWVKVVMSASIGFMLTLAGNAALCVYLAWQGQSPAIGHALDQRFLVLAAWGCLAPFVWGFSLKWLPVLLGLRPGRTRLIPVMLSSNVSGIALALAGRLDIAVWLLLAAAIAAVFAIRIFEPPVQPAKTRGVHATFPLFVRMAYVWLIAGAALGVSAAYWDVSGGIWGASRHAFTVGFISTMVFSIGQRVLPQFAQLRPLWSPRLMFAGLALLNLGCALRVTSEVLAYQHYADAAWAVLPVSAVIEMAAVTCFALNLGVTFVLEPEGVSGHAGTVRAPA